MIACLALLLAQGVVKVELRKEGAVDLDKVRAAGKDPLVEVDVEAGTPAEKGLELLKRCYQAGARRFKFGGQSLVLRSPERIKKEHSGEMNDILLTLCGRGKPHAHARDPKAHLQDALTGELKGFVEKIDVGSARTAAERDALFRRAKERAALLYDVSPPGMAVARLECCPGVSFDDVLCGLAALPQPASFSVLGMGEPEGVDRPAPPPGLEPGKKILELDK
jgi:hypothetical protein